MVNHRGRQHYSSSLPTKQWLSVCTLASGCRSAPTKLRLPCALVSPPRLLSGMHATCGSAKVWTNVDSFGASSPL